uniref:Transmembrane protein n=1 Tax=Panagrellus redivivus TaxID=6233 RepID=A0A7E4ZW26_PANRE
MRPKPMLSWDHRNARTLGNFVRCLAVSTVEDRPNYYYTLHVNITALLLMVGSQSKSSMTPFLSTCLKKLPGRLSMIRSCGGASKFKIQIRSHLYGLLYTVSIVTRTMNLLSLELAEVVSSSLKFVNFFRFLLNWFCCLFCI